MDPSKAIGVAGAVIAGVPTAIQAINSVYLTETRIRIVNYSRKDIIDIECSGLDDFDWVNDNRPDRMFQHLPIPAGKKIEAPADVKTVATGCPFSVTLTFKDGSFVKLRIDQKYVINGKANFRYDGKQHKVGFSKEGRTLILTVYDN